MLVTFIDQESHIVNMEFMWHCHLFHWCAMKLLLLLCSLFVAICFNKMWQKLLNFIFISSKVWLLQYFWEKIHFAKVCNRMCAASYLFSYYSLIVNVTIHLSSLSPFEIQLPLFRTFLFYTDTQIRKLLFLTRMFSFLIWNYISFSFSIHCFCSFVNIAFVFSIWIHLFFSLVLTGSRNM